MGGGSGFAQGGWELVVLYDGETGQKELWGGIEASPAMAPKGPPFRGSEFTLFAGASRKRTPIIIYQLWPFQQFQQLIQYLDL